MMKKSLLIITILVVIVAALVGWKFLGKSKTSPATPAETQPAQPTQTQTTEEGFTGRLKDALTKNVPLKCTYKIDENNYGTAWLKNQKYYGEIVSSGKTGYMILVDNCVWNWSSEENEGAKTCFAPQENKDAWANIEKEQKSSIDYHCVPTVVNDEIFTPPSQVKFVDVDEMMKRVEQPNQATEEWQEE